MQGDQHEADPFRSTVLRVILLAFSLSSLARLSAIVFAGFFFASFRLFPPLRTAAYRVEFRGRGSRQREMGRHR